MVSLFKNRIKRLPIGLDVGESGLRMAEVRQQGQRFVIVKTLQHEQPGARPREDSQDGAKQLRRRIASLVRSAGIRRRCIAVELNPPEVEFHPLELPSAALANDETKVGELVRWEIDRLLGDASVSFEIRHWLLPSTKIPGPSVMGTAAQREAVLEMVEVCDAAGVHCLSVEPGSVALSRVGRLLKNWDAKDLWGMLDLGAKETRLILCVDGVPTVVRRAGSGGRAWTTRIADSLQLGVRAAEIQKREQGIAHSSRGVRGGPGGPPAREVASILLGALRSDLKDIASEIKQSYEYALSCYPTHRAAHLILVGGGAAMRNLPEFLGDALQIPVARASDFLAEESCGISFETGKTKGFDEFAVAVGLALPS